MIAAKQPMITVRVWRGGRKGAKGTKDAESAKDVALNGGCEGNESGGGELQAFQIPFAEGDTVLTALLYIYENLDSTLAFRHGCRAGRCGLCAVEVNGKPRLACKTPVGRSPPG
ncbi:MAG: 2Fe-2S iron-sulfur cluster-binding protein [Syntrophothermus sp.]